jgi:hypothetical protein
VDRAGALPPGERAGHGRLIGRLAEAAHQSCVLLTSREKPREIEPLEGVRSPVRSLRLAGLDDQAARVLLTDKGVVGTPAAWQRLVDGYAGNPLALKILAQAVSNGVRPVLRQQVGRRSAVEHDLRHAPRDAPQPEHSRTGISLEPRWAPARQWEPRWISKDMGTAWGGV